MKKGLGLLTIQIFAFSILSMGIDFSFAGSEPFDEKMLPILSEYLIIADKLASDKTDSVTEAAKKIEGLAGSLSPSLVTGEHASHYKNLPKNIAEAAKKMSQAKDIASMRSSLVELSKPMGMWTSMSKPAGINLVYCSMRPGAWLQKGSVIRNPYYGAKMARCGEIVSGPDAKKK